MPSGARPYDATPSRCLSLPGFHAREEYPMRSPLVVADFLVDRLAAAATGAASLRGGEQNMSAPRRGAPRVRYAEIGTRDGDNVACVAQLSHTAAFRAHGGVGVAAVEQSPRRCSVLRARAATAAVWGGEFAVVEARVNDSSFLDVLPRADVWYIWVVPEMNADMVRWIDGASRSRGERATVYIGFDWHYPPDRAAMAPQLLRFRKRYRGASLQRLFFDEQGAREGVGDEGGDGDRDEGGGGGGGAARAPAADDETREKMRQPSYLRPFARRPGQWGVFHVVGVQVGV